VRRQTPASVCVPTQPVAAVLSLCLCQQRCPWCAIGSGRLGGTRSCAAARVLHSAHALSTDRPHAHKTLSHSASLSYVLHFWYSTYSRSAHIHRRPCTGAALAAVPEVRVERARDSSQVPVQEAALVPLESCKATASPRLAPARHMPTLERAYDCAHRGSTSALHRPPDLPHAPAPTRPEAGHTTTHNLHHHTCQR
jgi:hypothetical protein